jgi:antiviral helicase SKI2
MDQEKHRRLIQQILCPTSDQAPRLLEDLELSGLPSREQVHREIEEKLLLPRERLPDHWLPTYQM